jgi:hypothetical protein
MFFITLLQGKSYPAAKAAIGLKASSDWEKTSLGNGFSFWKNKNRNLFLQGDLFLSLDSKKIWLFNYPSFTGEKKIDNVKIPQSYYKFQSGSVASGWSDSANILQKLVQYYEMPINLPGENIMFAIKKNDYDHEVSFRIGTKNSSSAKAIASMIMLVRNNIIFDVDESTKIAVNLFFANAPSVDGNSVIITTGIMSLDDITDILLRLLN